MATEPRPDIEDQGNSDLLRQNPQATGGQSYGYPGGERDTGAAVIKAPFVRRENGRLGK